MYDLYIGQQSHCKLNSPKEAFNQQQLIIADDITVHGQMELRNRITTIKFHGALFQRTMHKAAVTLSIPDWDILLAIVWLGICRDFWDGLCLRYWHNIAGGNHFVRLVFKPLGKICS